MIEREALEIIARIEDEHTERKAAGSGFDLKDLSRYIVALSNEGGGHILLGVSDDGRVTGTPAFPDIMRLKNDVRTSLRISRRTRIEVDVFNLGQRQHRVLIVTVPPRPRGEALSYDGAFLMRSGESLVGMTSDVLKSIMAEDVSDYSADIIEGAKMADLDPIAIEQARYLWLTKSGNEAIELMTPQEVVLGLGLADERGVTRSGIILLGRESAISRFVPNAEVVWEYRKTKTAIEYVARADYKKAFVSIYEDLWNQINSRNDVAHINEGFFIRDIPSFDEIAVREAVLNAVSHRDYQDQGSVYLRQSAEELLVESPGGFIEGITPENIMTTSSKPRNRLIAEAFQKLGLVERSGQGVDKIFMKTIASGKGKPTYEESTSHEVKLSVSAQIQDVQFVQYLDKVSRESGIKLSASDYVLLESVRLGKIESMNDDTGLPRLQLAGIIEKSRSGRYVKPMLAKRFYSALNKRGEYTRQRGLDHEQKKQLILKHLENYPKGYIQDIEQALGYEVGRSTLSNWLSEMKKEGIVDFIGNKHIVRGPNRGYWSIVKK
jgi:ATP-dependent DNA helicase RecG